MIQSINDSERCALVLFRRLIKREKKRRSNYILYKTRKTQKHFLSLQDDSQRPWTH